ncbi:MAG: type II secretion system protein GspL [Caulobacteraceae bacterium]|nr:type II secretion system protein GspL [Caulobacteraceae bacterium]
MNRTRIVISGVAPDAEPRYLIVDELGSIVGRGILPVQEPSALTPMRTILVVPGAEVTVRWAELRAASPAQAQAAARLLLAEQLAQQDGLHLAVGPAAEDQDRLICIMSAARLQAFLDQAALHGVVPDVVAPDHLCLQPPEEAEAAALLLELEDRWVARADHLALSGEPDLVEVVMDQKLVRRLTGAEGEQALARGALAAPVNLLQGAFDPARRDQLTSRDVRRPAILAAALLLSPILLIGGQTLADHWRAEAAEARMAQMAAEWLPADAPPDQAAAQIEALVASRSLTAGGGASGLLARTYAVIEPLPQAQLENFILMPEGTARAAVSLAAYADMERLSEQARQVGLSLREEGSRETGGRVVVDIVVGGR